jgi:uncharacterized protein involved in outer membrane biogenesis
MKKTIIPIAVVLVLLVTALLILSSQLGNIIETAVRKGGPIALGVPIQLEQADMQLMKGKVAIKGLIIGNPEGFKTDYLFSLGSIDVDLDMRSLLSDTIHIRSIIIEAPKITYERGLTSSNIGTLTDSLEGDTPKKEKKDAKPKREAGGKTVIIDELRISGARVNISTKIMGGMGTAIPLPSLTLTDIGKKSNGATVSEVIGQVLPAVTKAVISVVTSAVALTGEGMGQAAGIAIGLAAGATNVGTDAAKQAVGGATDLATDAAAGTAKAIGAGAKGLLGGIKKVVPGGDD